MPSFSFKDFSFNIRLVDQKTGCFCRVLGHGNPHNFFLEIEDIDSLGRPINREEPPRCEQPPAAAANVEEVDAPAAVAAAVMTNNNGGCDVVELLNSSGSSSGSRTELNLSDFRPTEDVEEAAIDDEVEFVGNQLDRSVHIEEGDSASDTSSDYSVAHGLSQEPFFAPARRRPVPAPTTHRSQRVRNVARR
ncbi:hypothetical protein SEMRO_43_G025870.1 [Seminavis robusta]|uniref:Uncharacterized protein n=1 Tax=Seminavis robusta TaxID=568900 RepID=A0A9N8DBB0_9STRA|nr:hypothetical protein SEMRO_43_G025870.1 [Seminavis robusta]|eukprot:Sro43_g025870.1 n/a (191) ;mRNA; f:424-996